MGFSTNEAALVFPSSSREKLTPDEEEEKRGPRGISKRTGTNFASESCGCAFDE